METQNSFSPVAPPDSALSEAPALSAALEQSQIDSEAEKNAFVRTLHDEIGGLLGAAIMDLGWIGAQPDLPRMVKNKLARAQGLMGTAIDLKRKLIETMRPTLLDDVGLYSTLRWHMKSACREASISYTESLPEFEGTVSAEIRIGVFRIFQEALKDVLSERTPSDLSLSVEVIENILHCHLVHQSAGRFDGAGSSASPETSMRSRAERVGGTFQWNRTVAGRHLHLRVPLVAPADADCLPE